MYKSTYGFKDFIETVTYLRFLIMPLCVPAIICCGLLQYNNYFQWNKRLQRALITAYHPFLLDTWEVFVAVLVAALNHGRLSRHQQGISLRLG